MLLEQRTDGAPMARGQRARLWLHLRYCPYCSRYAKQTAQVAELARAAATARANSSATLTEAAKQRMRERLSAAGKPPVIRAQRSNRRSAELIRPVLSN